jgi:hypothetical protein
MLTDSILHMNGASRYLYGSDMRKILTKFRNFQNYSIQAVIRSPFKSMAWIVKHFEMKYPSVDLKLGQELITKSSASQ